MTNKIQYFIFLLTLIFSVIISDAQVNLHQKISIKAEGLNAEQILGIIEQEYDFYFAYNPDFLQAEKKISVSEKNASIKQVLNEILSEQFTYKSIGDHIILRPKNQFLMSGGFKISGIVTNMGNVPLDSVIIYAVKDNKAVITGTDGSFSVLLKQQPQYINISHPFYNDTLILSSKLDSGIPIRLSRDNKLIVNKYLNPAGIKRLDVNNEQFENLALVKKFVPKSTMFVTKQVKTKHTIPFQVSFLPGVGSQMLVHGLEYNCFSMNVLAGYSKGVSGLEFGGIANIIQENMTGAQFGGIANIVNGKTKGLQAAGIYNQTFDDITGAQLAGIWNFSKSNIKGVQIAGIVNTNLGAVNGVQLAGIVNLNSEEVTGVQMAGIANVSLKEIHRVQAAGIYNVASSANGVQLAGIFNYTAGGNVKGIQLSGIFNRTKTLNGVQIGLVNIADSVENGVQVGLFNIVKNGYRAFELTCNETFPFDFMYKVGGKRMYSIVNAAVDKGEVGVGYGIGFIRPIYKKISGNVDIFQTPMFSSDLDDYLGQKTSARLALNYNFRKHLGITGGVSLNYFNPDSEGTKSGRVDGMPFCGNSNNVISESILNNNKAMWVGWFLGIRL